MQFGVLKRALRTLAHGADFFALAFFLPDLPPAACFSSAATTCAAQATSAWAAGPLTAASNTERGEHGPFGSAGCKLLSSRTGGLRPELGGLSPALLLGPRRFPSMAFFGRSTSPVSEALRRGIGSVPAVANGLFVTDDSRGERRFVGAPARLVLVEMCSAAGGGDVTPVIPGGERCGSVGRGPRAASELPLGV
eukprot:CAMPEP_0174851910 /NCGR_PEP_ID=MMETSP1114-20130205/24448_1 /TAXON_ID=312471 /ORGANISM="Neobodo designis, Strain CCAP 1951/1" /LENGTH=193 /DNA_ID=CAMNT_0016086477 /DNA_START=274 /DNA_END=855 /DNA_ORIENTATION=-